MNRAVFLFMCFLLKVVRAVFGGGNADDLFESFGEVVAIGKAHLLRNGVYGQFFACRKQFFCLFKAELIHVRAYRNAEFCFGYFI